MGSVIALGKEAPYWHKTSLYQEGWNTIVIKGLFLFPFLSFTRRSFQNSRNQIIIRASSLALMIILGLTAIAPTWLDLAGLILRDIQVHISESFSLYRVDNNYSDYLHLPKEWIASFHSTIIKPIAPKPHFSGPLSGLAALIWKTRVTLLYSQFMMIYLLISLVSLFLLRRNIKRYALPSKHRYSLYLVTASLSFWLSLFAWNYSF